MNYIAYHTNGTSVIVDSYTYDTSTSLVLSGPEYSSYDKAFWSNIVHLLENFSSPYAPVAPTDGQLWYDNLNQKLKVYSNTTWVNLSPYTGDASSFATGGDILTGKLIVNTPKSANSVANRKYVESKSYSPTFGKDTLTYVKHANGYVTAQIVVSSLKNPIQFPFKMVDTKYSIICTVNTTADVADKIYYTVYDKSTTGFQISASGIFDTIACIITGFAQ